MAATTIMYEGPRHSIGAIELDAVVTETHGAEVEITDFPHRNGKHHHRPRQEEAPHPGHDGGPVRPHRWGPVPGR